MDSLESCFSRSFILIPIIKRIRHLKTNLHKLKRFYAHIALEKAIMQFPMEIFEECDM